MKTLAIGAPTYSAWPATWQVADWQWLDPQQLSMGELLAQITVHLPERLLIYLEWTTLPHHRNSLPGLDLYCQIRLDIRRPQLMGLPIMVVGWFPLEHYLAQDPDARLLLAPNTYFRRLPDWHSLLWEKATPQTTAEHMQGLLPLLQFHAQDAAHSIHDARSAFGAKQLHRERMAATDPASASTLSVDELWILKMRLFHLKSRLQIDSPDLSTSEEMMEWPTDIPRPPVFRVLWVEDQAAFWEESIRAIWAEQIAPAQLQMTILGSYAEAEAVINQGESQWDVLVLDLRLGQERIAGHETLDRIGGLRLLPHIRSRYPQLPIIIFSASENPLLIKAAYQRGAQIFLTKGVASLLEVQHAFKSAFQAAAFQSWAGYQIALIRPKLSSEIEDVVCTILEELLGVIGLQMMSGDQTENHRQMIQKMEVLVSILKKLPENYVRGILRDLRPYLPFFIETLLKVIGKSIANDEVKDWFLYLVSLLRLPDA